MIKKLHSKKTYFSQIISAENLHNCLYKAARHKHSTTSYMYFRLNLEKNLAEIQEKLAKQSWECGKYRQFTIYEPKKRIITAAPFEDRIVHHAIINVTEPLFERNLIFHTYACRKGKGSHAAIKYAQKFCIKEMYFIKLDVRKYFDSIDHKILKRQLKKLTNEAAVNLLFEKIIDSYSTECEKGLPIGNLTSQYFANLYLSGCDHFVLEKLNPKGYVRYMDDMLVFSRSMKDLTRIEYEIRNFCCQKLLLELKAPVFGKCSCGIPFLGKLITKKEIKTLSEKRRLKRKKIKKIDNMVKKGILSQQKAAERINAIIADCHV